MPNGWSGGFYLARKQLEQLLANCEDSAELGSTTKKPVTAADVREIMKHWNDDRLYVEEQDHQWYIMQFPDTKEWIVVTSESPLYVDFRQYHEESRKERAKNHPPH